MSEPTERDVLAALLITDDAWRAIVRMDVGYLADVIVTAGYVRRVE